MSMFAKGDEVAANQALEKIWANLTSDSQIFTWNSFPSSLFKGSSIANSDPLRELLSTIFGEYGGTKRKYNLGVTNFDTGQHETFDENMTSDE